MLLACISAVIMWQS